MKQYWKISVVFILLFLVYHGAEYMIVFENNVVGFLLLQGLFFIMAWFLGNWYSGNGLKAWGLPFNKKGVKMAGIGLIMGILLYGLPFMISLLLGVEQVVNIPDIKTMVMMSLPFAFGVLFSSFSEDVLTRGIIYSQFHTTLKPVVLALCSALVYLLNHIYRLTDGPESWSYIFMLGLVFIIPVLNTGNLWFTGMMHWAGNVFFHVTYNVIQTETNEGTISANYLFALCMIAILPIVWWVSKTVRPDFNSGTTTV